MSAPLLDVRNLATSFFTGGGEVRAVGDVSYHVDAGEVVAIVGESGCGKSVAQMSILHLLASPPGRVMGGQALFEGADLLALAPTSRAMRAVRGAGIAMIFQEPMTSLNPVLSIGRQLVEVIQVHTRVDRREAGQRAEAALRAVGITEPRRRMANYPFELSGGMRQRVTIAMAIACEARLIIADEPTTALDVTTQAQVMDLLVGLSTSRGTALVLITHNLGLVTRYAARVYVMYAGRIVEGGTAEQVLTTPRHPYTVGLLASIPRLDAARDADLVPIEGAPPRLDGLPPICAFTPRCAFAADVCRTSPIPVLRPVGAGAHVAACHRDIAGAAS